MGLITVSKRTVLFLALILLSSNSVAGKKPRSENGFTSLLSFRVPKPCFPLYPAPQFGEHHKTTPNLLPREDLQEIFELHLSHSFRQNTGHLCLMLSGAITLSPSSASTADQGDPAAGEGADRKGEQRGTVSLGLRLRCLGVQGGGEGSVGCMGAACVGPAPGQAFLERLYVRGKGGSWAHISLRGGGCVG